MEKNKLYTVNKWNKPLFGNQFLGTGEYPNFLGYTNQEIENAWKGAQAQYTNIPGMNPSLASYGLDIPANPEFSLDYGFIKVNPWASLAATKGYSNVDDYTKSTNFFGLSKLDNPFSRGNIAGGIGAMAKTPFGGMGLMVGSQVVGGLARKALSDGFSTGVGDGLANYGSMVGSAIGTVNPLAGAVATLGSNVLGGAWNHTFGMKTNKDALNNYNNALASWNNYTSNANTYDQIQGPENFSFQNIYKGGWARGHDARQKNRNALANFNAAKDFAYRSMDNNIYNIGQNIIEDYMRGYGAALGGSLKAHGGNLFPDGGVLPEVVVTPSAEDKQVRKNLWSLFPDKDMRDSVYAYYDRQHIGDRLAQNEFLNNITTLHNLSGNPTIHRGDVISFLPAQYRKSNGTPRPHYVNNIVTPNDMYNINNFNDYLDELTHAYQYHGPKRYGLDTISWPGDIEINGKSGYDREGHPENAAHKVIGDAMKRYLIDNGLTMRNGRTNRENFVDKLALGIPDNYPVGQDWLKCGGKLFSNGGGIHIDPSKKGTFTAAASKHGMGVQEFASKVLSNKEDYSPAMVKKANFARNASKWHGLGGNLYSDGGPKGKKLIDDINSRSSADFVNRLKDENRSYIPDWNNRSNPYDYNWVTHKMSWATDENGDAIVYPEVQTMNGKLHDFTDPWYGHGKWDGFNNAVENGDTLRMSPEQADWFTRNYKNYYPKGNTFAGGGYTAASFVDDFSQDPIAAVMKYNQMQSDMVAQREAMEEERAREEQMQNLQKQLMEAQTNYQGLQSLYDSQATAIKNLQDAYGSPIIPPGANPGLLLAGVLSDALDSKGWSTGTLPKNNKNWNYIKRKLKASGKFTDTQIEGIGLSLNRESGFDPDAVGDNGSAIGIAQWRGKRQPKDRSLDGQITHLINTLAEYDGRDHWIGKKNYNGFMNARTPEEAHYYIANGWERPKAVITDSLRREMNNSLINAGYAFGGELGTNGTDWYNGLLQVNEGSSHEMNPLGGVPMGVDQQGTPNLVEEGETVYAFGGNLGLGNYVFSKRKENEGGFNVPIETLALVGIKPSKKELKEGISYADASKRVSKESEERPNDKLSKDGLEHSLALLAQSQEQQRQEKQAMEQMIAQQAQGYMAACGGTLKKYGVGGNLFATAGQMNTVPVDPPSREDFDSDLAYEAALQQWAHDRLYQASDSGYTQTAPTLDQVISEAEQKAVTEDLYRRAALFNEGMTGSKKTANSYKGSAYPGGRSKTKGGGSRGKNVDENTTIPGGIGGGSRNDYNPNVAKNVWLGSLLNSANPISWPATLPAMYIAAKAIDRDNGIGANRPPMVSQVGRPEPTISNNRNQKSVTKASNARKSQPNTGYADLMGAISELADAIGSASNAPVSEVSLTPFSDAFKAQVLRNAPTVGIDGNVYGPSMFTNNPSRIRFSYARNSIPESPLSDTNTPDNAGATNNEPANTGAADVVAPTVPGITNTPGQYGNLLPLSPFWTSGNPNVSLQEVNAFLADRDFRDKFAAGVNPKSAQSTSTEDNNTGVKTYDTWMRYAPVFGSGILTLTDLLGLTSKPDYTYANKLEAYANRAGYTPNIGAPHIGDYMRYIPTDRQYMTNLAMANARATDRNLMNLASGNRAQAMAGILSNGYNTTRGIGDIFRGAEDANYNRYATALGFNRGTNQFNAQQALQAALANAQYRTSGLQLGLSGLAQAAQMRAAQDAMANQARSANITNLLQSLSNIGRENFAINQLNFNRAFDNGTTNTGESFWKRSKKKKGDSSNV